MKVKDLNGKIHSWNLGKYVGKQNINCSEPHERTRMFLEDNFPAIQILEEVFLPGERLFLDFFLPIKKIAIEMQGQQHNTFSLYMHNNKLNFAKSKARDSRKAEFCKINNITLIYFYPDEKEEEWMIKLGIKTNGK